MCTYHEDSWSPGSLKNAVSWYSRTEGTPSVVAARSARRGDVTRRRAAFDTRWRLRALMKLFGIDAGVVLTRSHPRHFSSSGSSLVVQDSSQPAAIDSAAATR